MEFSISANWATAVSTVVTLLALLLNVKAGSICTPKVDVPQWYEPEYEAVPITIEAYVITRNKTNHVVSTQKERYSFTGAFGYTSPPPVALTFESQITNSANISTFHNTLKISFNGTDVGLAINYAELRDGGSIIIPYCQEQHIKPFLPSSEEIMFFRDPFAETRDYLIVNTDHPYRLEKAVHCWVKLTPHTDDMPIKSPGRLEYCPFGTKCMVSLVQTEQSSPTQYHAGCPPNDTNICSSPECAKNTVAPHIGNGTFHRVCNFCCGYGTCNNIRNCTADSCRFYGPPMQPTPPTTTDPMNSGNAHLLSLLLLFFSMLSNYSSHS